MNLDLLIARCPDCGATLNHIAYTEGDNTRWSAHCTACRWHYDDLPVPLDVRQALTSLNGFPELLAEVVRDLEALPRLRREHEAMRLRLLAEVRDPAGFPAGWAPIGNGIYERTVGPLILQAEAAFPRIGATVWIWRIFRGLNTAVILAGSANYLRDAMLEADEGADHVARLLSRSPTTSGVPRD